MGTICITGKVSYYVAKVLYLPFIILFSLAMILLPLLKGKVIEIAFSLYICIFLFLFTTCGLLWLRMKIIYIFDDGVLLNKEIIQWKKIERIFFLTKWSRIIIVKYKGNHKSQYIYSLLPFFKKNAIKKIILNVNNRK